LATDFNVGDFRLSPLIYLNVDFDDIQNGKSRLSDIGLPGVGIPVTYTPLGFTYAYLAPDPDSLDNVRGNTHFVRWSFKW